MNFSVIGNTCTCVFLWVLFLILENVCRKDSWWDCPPHPSSCNEMPHFDSTNDCLIALWLSVICMKKLSCAFIAGVCFDFLTLDWRKGSRILCLRCCLFVLCMDHWRKQKPSGYLAHSFCLIVCTFRCKLTDIFFIMSVCLCVFA